MAWRSLLLCVTSWERRGDGSTKENTFELKVNISWLLPCGSMAIGAFLCVFLEAVPPSLCICSLPLACAPLFPQYLHEAMFVGSVSYFISDLSDGEGCQVNSSAPHCLLSLRRAGHSRAWHSSLQDQAGESQVHLKEGRGRQRRSRPCRLTAWAPWALSAFTHLPSCLLTSLLPPPSLLTPTPLHPVLGMWRMCHSILRNTHS